MFRVVPFVLSLFIMFLTACGGVGTTSSVGNNAAGPITGIDGTGGELPSEVTKIVSLGSISSENGLTVNGVTYDASEAQISINGQPGLVSNLSLGQVVTVTGNLNDNQALGTAREVSYQANLRGPISKVDGFEITVLNQIINIEDAPVYGNNISAGDLMVGAIVEVSGFRKADNSLVASRIDVIDTAALVISGSISGLNNTAFYINEQRIDYSQVAVTELINGLNVEVVGQLDGDTFLAQAINVLQTPFIDTDLFELEGFITDINESFEFKINEHTVVWDYDTIFKGGESRHLNVDTKVEVEGVIDEDGRLQAKKIIFLVATIISHQENETLHSTAATFSWNSVEGAVGYVFTISDWTSNKIYHEERLEGAENTSVTLDSLPQNGARMIMAIRTLYGNNRWAQRYRNVFGVNQRTNARIKNFKVFDSLPSTKVTFEWDDVGADGYQFKIRNAGDKIKIDLPAGSSSVTVDNLPEHGAFLEVHLATRWGDWWGLHKMPLSSLDTYAHAVFTSHKKNQQLTTRSATFEWSAAEDADGYQLVLTNHKGAFLTVPTNETSVTVKDILPANGAEFRAYIYTERKGYMAAQYLDLFGASLLDNSEITNLENDTFIPFSNVLFQWSDVNAQAYQLQVRANGVVLYEKRFTEVFEVKLPQLDTDADKIYVTLSTLIEGFWGEKQYTFWRQLD